jgi:hypothetical protein
MGVTEIGALLIAIRTESAQFRAEMDKGKEALKGVGTHAATSSRQMARFAAIAAEQVVPGLQGWRTAIEGVVVAGSKATGVLGLAARAGGLLGAGLLGFGLGNAIRNFIELRQQGHGWIESAKLAVGITKSYADSVKEAAAEQKKFSEEMARNRAITQGLDKEIATLTEDYRKLAEIGEIERRARIQNLPLAEREAATRKSALITELQLLEARTKKEQEIAEARAKQAEKGQAAATELKLAPSSLVFGLKEVETFQKNVDALGQELIRLAAKGIPARDLFAEITAAQEKIDLGLEELKKKFPDVPIVQNRIADLQRSIGGGEFQRGIDNTVRGMQKLAPGIASVEDESGKLLMTTGKTGTAFTEAGDQANFFAAILFEDIPQAVSAAQQSVVIVTGSLISLAQAFAEASRQATFFETVVGAGGNVAPAAPGNF